MNKNYRWAIAAAIFIFIYAAVANADSSWGGGSAGTLQEVTDEGAITTAIIDTGGLNISTDEKINFSSLGNTFFHTTSAASSTIETLTGLEADDRRNDGNNALTAIKADGSGSALRVQHTTSEGYGEYLSMVGSGAYPGIYLEMGASTSGYALDTLVTGSGGAAKLWSHTTSQPIVDARAFGTLADKGIYESRFPKVEVADGYHWRGYSSAYSFGQYNQVGFITEGGSLALGWDVSRSLVGDVRAGTDQTVLFASGSIGTNGNFNASGTAYYGGLVTATAGINFGASGGADTLSFYETATWTPVYKGSTNLGSESCTYSAQSGSYTRIGNFINADAVIGISSCATAPTGNARMYGFPYAANSTAGYQSACSIGYLTNHSLTANNIMTASIAASAQHIVFWQTPVGGGAASNAGVDADNAFTIVVKCSYLTD